MEIDFKVRFKSEDVEDSSNEALSMRVQWHRLCWIYQHFTCFNGRHMSDKKVTEIIVLVADMYMDRWECRHQVYIHDPPARITAT